MHLTNRTLALTAAALLVACGAPLERSGPVQASLRLDVSDGSLTSSHLELAHLSGDCLPFATGSTLNGWTLEELDPGGTRPTVSNLVVPETRCTPARYQVIFGEDERPIPSFGETVRLEFWTKGFAIESTKALSSRFTVLSPTTLRRGQPLVIEMPKLPGVTNRALGTGRPPPLWADDGNRVATSAEEKPVEQAWEGRALDETTWSLDTSGLTPGSWSVVLRVRVDLPADRCDGFSECLVELNVDDLVEFKITP